jgi:ECF sigma factor
MPELYPGLRRLAAALTARLRPGQTLQPTALVHEAYLRLVGSRDPGREGRHHFFEAAAAARPAPLAPARERAEVGRRTGSADDPRRPDPDRERALRPRSGPVTSRILREPAGEERREPRGKGAGMSPVRTAALPLMSPRRCS